jgi:hypothetical protein
MGPLTLGLQFVKDHRGAVAVAAALAISFGLGRASKSAPPSPAVVAKQSIDASSLQLRELELHKVATGTVQVVTKYLPAACGQPQQIAERIETHTGPVVTDAHSNSAAATSSHAEQSVAVTPPVELPRLMLGAGADALGDHQLFALGGLRVTDRWWIHAVLLPAPLLHGNPPGVLLGLTKSF